MWRRKGNGFPKWRKERTKTMKNEAKTYTLKQLGTVDIDSWVEGISNLYNEWGIAEEAYGMAGLDFPKEDKPTLKCPAELERELTEISDRYGFRYDWLGRIVAFDRTGKKRK